MAAWVKEEANASEHRWRKRKAEEAHKVEVAPGVTADRCSKLQLRRFRGTLIEPAQELPRRHRLCR